MQIITGLLAYGMSGEIFHAPLLHSLPELFKIKTITERNNQKSSLRYPYIKCIKNIDELLNDKEIELIIVNTPDHTHFEFAQKALKANKHVIIEKPFTQTVKEADALIKLAKKQNKIISVFQNRRWDNDFLTVKEIINKKLLGRLVEFESHFDRYRNFIQDTWKENPKTKTGTIYNLGSHLIDQALDLFGMPYAVYADIRMMRDNARVDDSYDIKLYYNENIRVTLKTSYLVREQGPRFTLHGTNGSFIKYGIDPQEQALKEGHYPSESNWGKESEDKWGLIHTEINEKIIHEKYPTISGDYCAYYKNIYDVIRNNNPLIVKAEQVKNVILIIEAAIESSKKGIRIKT